jgi:hypothetical protein
MDRHEGQSGTPSFVEHHLEQWSDAARGNQ